MKILLISVFTVSVIFLIAIGGYACEMNFSLLSPDGTAKEILPGKSISLSAGESYTLRVKFTPDHRKCIVSPEETIYLLLEEKWKSSKDYLPLQLVSRGEWVLDSSQTNVQKISFKAIEKGSWELEIIRDCSKGGYDEFLTFQVQ
ncbi:MAG: hypothetical protein KAT88_11285 [Spirochaetes bacterium]|nr:hypothetical protein [Spirochaetota bacterium]